MKHKVVAAGIGVLMAASMSTAAVAVAASDDGDDQGSSKVEHKVKADKAEKAEKAGKDQGHPPPWAGHGRASKGSSSWKDAWKALTPAQRAATMAGLAERHAVGMKKFAACAKAAGENAEARGKCVKPLPPGLAKKQLRP